MLWAVAHLYISTIIIIESSSRCLGDRFGCWLLRKKKHCFTFIIINLLNFLTEENVLKSKNMIICPVSCKNANFCGWRDGLETWLATPSWKRCLYVSKFMCSKRLFQDHLSCNTLCSFIKIRQFLYRINLQDIKLFLLNKVFVYKVKSLEIDLRYVVVCTFEIQMHRNYLIHFISLMAIGTQHLLSAI